MTILPIDKKRLKFAVYVFHLYFILGVYAMETDKDLNALGLYLGFTSIPLLAYIFGDTFRPSTHKEKL